MSDRPDPRARLAAMKQRRQQQGDETELAIKRILDAAAPEAPPSAEELGETLAAIQVRTEDKLGVLGERRDDTVRKIARDYGL